MKVFRSKSKYASEKTVLDGITFDSRKEARRYAMLRLMEKKGLITNLQRQVPFDLAPAQYVDVVRHLKTKDKTVQVMVRRPMRYIADFTYYENGRYIVEDTKGFRTDEYKKKKNLMRRIYEIEIKET